MSFWESSFLWLEAVVAACAVGAVCAVVGVYTILRRVVFLPAALSQVSGFGVVLAFILPVWVSSLEGALVTRPEFVAGTVTLVASLGLGWVREPRRVSRDAMIGVAFIVASALILMISGRIPQDAHDVRNVLFGNAVAVERTQMIVALAMSAVVLLMHALLMRPFLLVSFDKETAIAHGVPVRALDAVLFLTMGATIAIATKAIGAMPVFAFSVLPPLGALMITHDIRLVFVLSALVGIGSAFFGYYVSFVYSLETGPCMAVIAGGVAAASLGVRAAIGRGRPGCDALAR